jgi:hypothetical protein
MALGTSLATAKSINWNQKENIRAAAITLAEVQKKEGAFGARDAVQKCYEQETAKGPEYTQGLERCIAMDIIEMDVSVAMYSHFSEETLKKTGSPNPEELKAQTSARISKVFGDAGVSQKAARKLLELVRKDGTDTFISAM